MKLRVPRFMQRWLAERALLYAIRQLVVHQVQHQAMLAGHAYQERQTLIDLVDHLTDEYERLGGVL